MYTQIVLAIFAVWLILEICKNDKLKRRLHTSELKLENSEKLLKEAREAAIAFYCQKKEG